jgi:hypothetical protein
MREALGLTSPRGQRENRPKPQTVTFGGAPSARGGAETPKRRFVRDGEVQVTLVSGGRSGEAAPPRRSHAPGAMAEHAGAAQAMVRAEKAAREKAERALKEMQEAVQDLRTKLGLVALARDEAIEAARRAEASRAALAQELETVRVQLSAEVSARARAERVAQRSEPLEMAPPPSPPAEPAARRGPGRPRKADTALAAAPKRKPGRPRVEREPEPVKWWLPKRKPRGARTP